MVVVDTDIDGGCTYINFFSACLLLRIYFFSSARKFIFMHIQKKWNFHEKSSYIQFHVFFCVICKRSINIHKNVAMDWAILSSKCVCVSIHRFLFFKLLKIGGIYTQHETDTKWKRAIPEKRQSELQAIRKMNRQKFTKKKKWKIVLHTRKITKSRMWSFQWIYKWTGKMKKKVQIHFIVFLTRAIARLNCQVPTLKEMMGNEIILCFYASVLIAEQKMKKK